MLTCTHTNRGRIHDFDKKIFCDECWTKVLQEPAYDKEEDPNGSFKNWTVEAVIGMRKMEVAAEKAERLTYQKYWKSLVDMPAYPVKQVESESAVESKVLKEISKDKPARGLISSTIDKYLTEGKYTLSEITELVEKELNKKLGTHVHSRVSVLGKSGKTVTKSADGKLKLI